MTDTPQRSADGPLDDQGAVVVADQLRLVPWILTDRLFLTHCEGYSLEDVVAAWLWLDVQAEAANAGQ